MPDSDASSAPLDGPDFFQQLADGAPVMIWMSGLDMGCFYFNRAWLEFRGRTREQEFGNGWAEGVHPEDLERCVNHYIGCFGRRIAFAMSYRLQNAAGDYRWILDRGAPHYLPDGTFLGFFGGCAEIEYEGPIVRNAELGASLGRMKEFAQRVAAEAVALHPRPVASAEEALQAFARSKHEEHIEEMRRRQHAVAEMHDLAADMLRYRGLPRGACVP